MKPGQNDHLIDSSFWPSFAMVAQKLQIVLLLVKYLDIPVSYEPVSKYNVKTTQVAWITMMVAGQDLMIIQFWWEASALTYIKALSYS